MKLRDVIPQDKLEIIIISSVETFISGILLSASMSALKPSQWFVYKLTKSEKTKVVRFRKHLLLIVSMKCIQSLTYKFLSLVTSFRGYS